MADAPTRPPGVTAIAGFFWFATLMSGLTAGLLLFPGTPLDDLWKANPDAQFGFKHLGGWAVVLMLSVCAACLCAAIGLGQYRRWGFRTAIVILAINIAGDTVSAALRHDWRTLIGIPIGGAMLFYLVQELRKLQKGLSA